MKELTALCLALINLLFTANSQTNGDYQSAATGNWNLATTWARYNGTSFVPAPSAPTSTDGEIHILTGHIVTINSGVSADQIIIDAGGMLRQNEGGSSPNLTLADGPGDDLTVNGTWDFRLGILRGPGKAVIGASGTLTLATNGTKEIRTDITNNGTLEWLDGDVTPTAITITNNATTNISAHYIFGNNNRVGAFINTGTVNVTNSSAGASFFQMGPSTNSGTINIDGGILIWNSIFTNTSNIIFSNMGTFANASGGTFNHNAGSAITGTGTFYNDGLLNLNIDQVFPSTLVFSNSVFGTIDGAGDLTINNNFTVDGIIGGTGTLTINNNITWNTSTLGRVLTIGATGILTITANQSITADFTNEGTIDWQGGNLAFDASVTITNNGNLNINGNNNFQDGTGTGTFINNGAVTKNSTGTTTFGMNTMTNNAWGTINGVGTIDILSTNFTNNGYIAPGLSPGLLTINSQEPLSTGSTLSIEMLDGTGPGTGHDQLLRNGNITLAGTLTVTETGTVPNGTYTIINLISGIVSGSFATTNLPAGYTIQMNAANVQLIKNVPLPLTLISFTAQKISDKKVNLQWVTADEQNVSHFEVQRSGDGINYTRLANVQALNSQNGGTYSYRDEAPLSTTNHYRLRMVDLDASAKLSPVRMVKFTLNGEVLVFPTVTKDKVYIQTYNKVMVRLFSVSGALLQQKQVVANDFIDLSYLAAGKYILQIGGEGKSVKIIKQ